MPIFLSMSLCSFLLLYIITVDRPDASYSGPFLYRPLYPSRSPFCHFLHGLRRTSRRPNQHRMNTLDKCLYLVESRVEWRHLVVIDLYVDEPIVITKYKNNKYKGMILVRKDELHQ